MLEQGIQHQMHDGVQLVAAPPIPRVERRSTHVAELKARQVAPALPTERLARSQNIQRLSQTWTGAFAAFSQVQKSPELLLTSQPQPPPEILRRRLPSYLLIALRDAAEKLDAQQFSEIYESIDWKTRSSSELMQAIGLALKAGALMIARKLASKGVRYHPKAEDIRKYARLLAPPELIRTNLPADPGPKADLAWFKEHGAAHRGRWVALRYGTLLAEGPTLQEVLAKIGGAKARKGLLLTRVR